VASAPLAPSRAVVPHASTPSQRVATPRAVVQPSQPGESKRSVPLRQQLELLQQARSLLRSGQPKEALVALDRYESELGGTDLRDEAALLRIEALAAQGRAAEAAALARRFVLEHPDSPLAERAQRLGAGH
jgi:outer membrane protein assembly factor BamD (BamD/ComL family)